MKVDKAGLKFVAHISFEQRHTFKRAGWLFDPVLKRWTTMSASIASEWTEFAVGQARFELEEYQRGLSGPVADSMASDAEIDVPAPDGLEYLPFQKAGIAYALTRKDTLIGDPPGLGKTIQAIGIVNYLRKPTKILILCPAFLKLNWEREYLKWDVHGLTVGIAKTIQKDVLDKDGNPKRKPSPGLTKSGKQKLGPKLKKTVAIYPDTNVVIVNDAMVVEFESQIKSTIWDHFIVDECHFYKNAKAARSTHIWGAGYGRNKVQAIVAKRRYFLTGTPLTRTPHDLWVYCRSFDSTRLGQDWETFVKRYCDAYKDHFGMQYSGASNLEELNFKMREAFLVRRDKSEVLSELPPKRRQIIPLPDDGLVARVEAEVNKVGTLLAEFKDMIGVVDDEDDEKVLAAMNKIFPEDIEDKSYEEIAGLMDNRQTTAFEDISLLRKALAMAKLPMVKEHCDRLLDAGEKILIFTHHNDVAKAMRKFYPEFGFITGSVPAMRRQKQVDAFQENDNIRGIIGTIGSMGVGYTLTEAHFGVFAEMTWLPSEMEQAEDRIWRIGQIHNVMIQHLVVNGSLDARFVELLVERMDIIDRALSAKKARKS